MRTPSLILTALLATSSVAFAQNGYPRPYNPQDPQNYGSPAGQQYQQNQQYDENGFPIQQQNYPQQQNQQRSDQQGYDQQQAYQGDNQNYDNGEQAYEETQQPPPDLPVYTQPVAPGYGYIWTPGYWAYTPYGYQWVPGAWVQPPYQNALWTPGYWGYSSDVYFWNPGYWGSSIGYYGGINYGFGYFGDGFYGGGWNNGIFFYNTAYWNCGRYDRYHYDRDDWREVREEHEEHGDREWLRAYGDNTAHLDRGVFHPSGPAFAHVQNLKPTQQAALVRGKANLDQGHMMASHNEAVVARNRPAVNTANRSLVSGQRINTAPITRSNTALPGAANHNQQAFDHPNVRPVPAPVQRGTQATAYTTQPQQQQGRPFTAQQQQGRPFAGGIQRPQQTDLANGYPHAVYTQQNQQQQNQQRTQPQFQQHPQQQYQPQAQQQYRPQPQQQYRPQPQQQYRPQPQQQQQQQQQFHATPQPQFHSAPQPSFHGPAAQGGNHDGHR
jgi:hypothetical protein